MNEEDWWTGPMILDVLYWNGPSAAADHWASKTYQMKRYLLSAMIVANSFNSGNPKPADNYADMAILSEAA